MIVNYKGKDVKLPDFLIVGAAKSGTTSLHYYLKQHPQIFMPKVKELWFLCFMDNPLKEVLIKRPWWKEVNVREFEDYAGYFSDAGNSDIIGEACTWYLYFYDFTIRNIKKIYGSDYKNLKIIIILRNPSERAWSHYLMTVRDGKESLDFKSAIKPEVMAQRFDIHPDFDHIGFGMYYKQVNAFMREFPHVKVFLYDDLCRDASGLVKEVFEFLGVDDGFTPEVETRYNVTGRIKSRWVDRLVRKPNPLKSFLKLFLPFQTRVRIKARILEKLTERQSMPDDIKKELTLFYRDDILKLQKLIGSDLSLWLKGV